MAYRQYFPSIATAEGGRPYSIAEFATESNEIPDVSYPTGGAYVPEPDLELGEPQQRFPREDGDGSESVDTTDGLHSPTSGKAPQSEVESRQGPS